MEQPEAMYDYSKLPTLVWYEIFGYLSVKERIECKSVCRSWKVEIELREKNRRSLLLHLGPFPWNLKWSLTNKLMKYENSFQIKQLTFLQHPLTRRLLKKTRKLAIVKYHWSDGQLDNSNINQYIGYFDEIEEIEILNFGQNETLQFSLPNLKTLMIKNSAIEKLHLNCPSLEALFLNLEVQEIRFQSVKKLKRLISFDWPARVFLDDNGKFDSLEYLNMFVPGDRRVNDLLDLTPKLKRFVLYSDHPHVDLASIRKQQARCGLDELEVLLYGFREPVKIVVPELDRTGFALDKCMEELFDNYTKLAENCPWKVEICYAQLFDKFKILPANFIERFPELLITIRKVNSYTHLFEFLKFYPYIEYLKLYPSKVDAELILDFMYLFQPSLKNLYVVEERAADLLNVDLSFIWLFNLNNLTVESTHLPVAFIRKLAAKKGSRGSRGSLRALVFKKIGTYDTMLIFLGSQQFILIDFNRESTFKFSTVNQLISHIQSDPNLRPLLLI